MVKLVGPDAGVGTVSGRWFRENLLARQSVDGRSLRSRCFTVGYNADLDCFIFHVYGYGHGCGMSQWGAIGYARNGWGYQGKRRSITMTKPKTLEQLRAEKERAETQLAQEQHKLERLENRKKYLEKGERTKRTHRLCNLGGTIESLAPAVKDLTLSLIHILSGPAQTDTGSCP